MKWDSYPSAVYRTFGNECPINQDWARRRPSRIAWPLEKSVGQGGASGQRIRGRFERKAGRAGSEGLGYGTARRTSGAGLSQEPIVGGASDTRSGHPHDLAGLGADHWCGPDAL